MLYIFGIIIGCHFFVKYQHEEQLGLLEQYYQKKVQ